MFNLANRGCGCGHNCRCESMNFYRFPQPLRKHQRMLDAKQLTIHEDQIITEECIVKNCHPEIITVKDSKKSFIISAVTECLDFGSYYTLVIPREVPFEAFGLDTYINVEKCGFFSRSEVGLNYTKSIHHRPHEHIDPIVGLEDRDRLDSVEVDGSRNDNEAFGGHGHGMMSDEQFDGGRFGCAGLIPGDPAFPASEFAGTGFRSRRGVLIPVVLDLHGNIATGKNFSTNRFKVPGTGLPYSNRFVLYLNNASTFVLSRDFRRRSDFA